MSNNDNENFEGLGKLLSHNYDNIRELDNPLPGWWLVTFWGCIVFAAFYYVYYTFLGGPTLSDELKIAMNEIKAISPASPTSEGGSGNKNLAGLVGNAAVLEKGKGVFTARCVVCHGQHAEGMNGLGPNLTDEYWISGDGTLEAIRDIVKKGVLEKGMPSWDPVIPPEEIDSVVIFVRSLQGSNPPNAKAPQGEKKERKD